MPWAYKKRLEMSKKNIFFKPFGARRYLDRDRGRELAPRSQGEIRGKVFRAQK